MNDSKNIYQKRLFCSNSRSRGNLCGKLPFPLGSRRFFIHSPMWKHFRLSTGVVEISGAFKNSTAFLSTFHSPCGENSGVGIRKPPGDKCFYITHVIPRVAKRPHTLCSKIGANRRKRRRFVNRVRCLRRGTFLSPNKKVPKEVGLGGGVESLLPQSKPPSP